MAIKTIGLMSPGDMGNEIGKVLLKNKYRVITSLNGRSDRTRDLCFKAGIEDLRDLHMVVNESDLILSIMPPSEAEVFANEVMKIIQDLKVEPLYAECNAIAPSTSERIRLLISSAGALYVDAGIIGPPPGRGEATRLYVSGKYAEQILPLGGENLKIISLGTDWARSSALKMCYAALTKGTMTLDTAVLLAGKQLGVYEELKTEFSESQPEAFNRMNNRIPWLSTDARRWIGEMNEIRNTLEVSQLPGGFHRGAAEIFSLLSESPLAIETVENADRSRTLDEAINIFAEMIRINPEESNQS